MLRPDDYLIGGTILGVILLAAVMLMMWPFHRQPAPSLAYRAPMIVETTPARPAPDPVVPKPVRLIPITVQAEAPADPPPPIPAPFENSSKGNEAEAVPAPEHPTDICARHGGHRVDYGRYWRCVYPKHRQ